MSLAVLAAVIVVVIAVAEVDVYMSQGSGSEVGNPASTTSAISTLYSQSNTSGASVTTANSSYTSPATTSVFIGGSGTLYDGYFDPANVTVVIGVNNTVTWVNGDSITHTVTSYTGAFNSGPLNPSYKFTHTFLTPGVYSYYCEVHPFMKGTVTVIQSN